MTTSTIFLWPPNVNVGHTGIGFFHHSVVFHCICLRLRPLHPPKWCRWKLTHGYGAVSQTPVFAEVTWTCKPHNTAPDNYVSGAGENAGFMHSFITSMSGGNETELRDSRHSMSSSRTWDDLHSHGLMVATDIFIPRDFKLRNSECINTPLCQQLTHTVYQLSEQIINVVVSQMWTEFNRYRFWLCFWDATSNQSKSIDKELPYRAH